MTKSIEEQLDSMIDSLDRAMYYMYLLGEPETGKQRTDKQSEQGKATPKPSGADLVVQRVRSAPTPLRQQENW